MSICLSACLFICLSVYLSVCLCVGVSQVVAWLIVVLGLLLLVVENYQAIDAVITAQHSPNGLCYQAQCGSDANSSHAA